MPRDGYADGFARGTFTLVLRQGLSMGLSALGLLLVARLVGSADYGAYVAAQAYVLVVAAVAQMGLGLALVRTPQEPDRTALDTAWLLLCGGGILAGLTGWALVGLLLPGDELAGTRAVVALMLAVQVAALPASVPLALLERRMAFTSIALVELGSQALWLGLSFALAHASAGVWALPAGWCLQQAALAVAWHVLAGHRPGRAFAASAAARLLRFGLAYAAATASWQLRQLAAPMIVGPRLGTEAVGQIGLASRLIEILSLVRHAVWRAGAPLLGRLADDAEGTARAVTAGGAAAAAATGALCALVVALRPSVEAVLGPSWRPTLDLFPAFAAQALVAALTGLVALALHVRGLALRVAVCNLVHIAVLAAVGWWAVGHRGLLGWGLAEAASGATFLLFILLSPSELRWHLARQMLPLLLLLPPVAWYLFLPSLPSALACIAALGGLGLAARRNWLRVRTADARKAEQAGNGMRAGRH
jgi:PST family polysaccharide transporter